MSGWTTLLFTGAAEYLDDGGAGTWAPAGDYTDGQTGITIDAILPSPDQLITLTDYPIDDLPGIADVRIGMQVRVRGTTDPRVAKDIGDLCYDLLHGLRAVTWGGIAVVQVLRISHAPMGQDPNKRFERSHNYAVDAMRPNALNTD